MKSYLHRNGATCRRLQCRTLISFVFNLNEEFCWGRLFPPYSWLVCVCVCVRVHACSTDSSCFLFAVLVSALRWLHLKLEDRSQHGKSCKWCNDGVPICWKLDCFSMTLLFSSICSIMMFADMCRLGADDTLQYVLCCNPLFAINLDFY